MPRGGSGLLVLFSDGQDEVSRSTFEQTLEVARGSAVSVYVFSLAEAFPTKRDRCEFESLAAETAPLFSKADAPKWDGAGS